MYICDTGKAKMSVNTKSAKSLWITCAIYWSIKSTTSPMLKYNYKYKSFFLSKSIKRDKTDILNQYFASQSHLDDDNKDHPLLTFQALFIVFPLCNSLILRLKMYCSLFSIRKACGPDKIDNKISGRALRFASSNRCSIIWLDIETAISWCYRRTASFASEYDFQTDDKRSF